MHLHAHRCIKHRTKNRYIYLIFDASCFFMGLFETGGMRRRIAVGLEEYIWYSVFNDNLKKRRR